MNGPRNEFLTCTGFAGDEYSRRRWRHLVNGFNYSTDRLAIPDDLPTVLVFRNFSV